MSYQDNNLYSRPFSNYEHSSVAQSQNGGASKHLFAHSKVHRTNPPSINGSAQGVEKTNSAHNMLVDKQIDSPKLEIFSSNSSKGEKETVKKPQPVREEIKEEQVQNVYERKESKRIEEKYILPVPELQLNVEDLNKNCKTAKKEEETLGNFSSNSQLTGRAKSRLAKANDRLGARIQKELEKSENRSLNSHRSANLSSKHRLHAKSPSSGNIFSRKSKFRSDAVSSKSKRSYVSMSGNRQNQN